MLTINSINLNLFTQMEINSTNRSKSIERLSSGKRINGAGDDAAGLAITSRLSSMVRGLDVAKRNVSDGLSLLSIAEGAGGEITESIMRMRELALRSATETVSANDRNNLNKEFAQLAQNIKEIVRSTNFNGIEVFQDAATSIAIQADSGSDVSSVLNISMINSAAFQGQKLEGSLQSILDQIKVFQGAYTADLQTAGIEADSVFGSLGTQNASSSAVNLLDSILDVVLQIRSQNGAEMGRLESIMSNIETMRASTLQSQSRIEDADFAAESSKFIKSQIADFATQILSVQADSSARSAAALLESIDLDLLRSDRLSAQRGNNQLAERSAAQNSSIGVSGRESSATTSRGARSAGNATRIGAGTGTNGSF